MPLLLSAAVFAADNNRSIEVGITTHLGDRQSFVAGDKISFFLSLDEDAFVYLYYQDAGGQLLQLIPNQLMPQNFYRAGLFMPLPPAQQGLDFIITPPFGDETLLVIASDHAGFSAAGEKLNNGLIRVDSDLDALLGAIKKVSTGAFGYSELRLQTMPRPAVE